MATQVVGNVLDEAKRILAKKIPCRTTKIRIEGWGWLREDEVKLIRLIRDGCFERINDAHSDEEKFGYLALADDYESWLY